MSGNVLCTENSFNSEVISGSNAGSVKMEEFSLHVLDLLEVAIRVNDKEIGAWSDKDCNPMCASEMV